MGVPARYKKEWLSTQVEKSLTQFTQDVNKVYDVENARPQIEHELFDWRFNWFKNRSLRIKIMGDPIWYTEILFTGPTTTLKESADGRYQGAIHEFAVALFLEYREMKSTTLFEDMTDGHLPGKRGLMLYLRDQGISRITYPNPTETSPAHKDSGDVICAIRETGTENEYRDHRSVINFDKSKPATSEKAHLLTFRVYISDIL